MWLCDPPHLGSRCFHGQHAGITNRYLILLLFAECKHAFMKYELKKIKVNDKEKGNCVFISLVEYWFLDLFCLALFSSFYLSVQLHRSELTAKYGTIHKSDKTFWTGDIFSFDFHRPILIILLLIRILLVFISNTTYRCLNIKCLQCINYVDKLLHLLCLPLQLQITMFQLT